MTGEEKQHPLGPFVFLSQSSGDTALAFPNTFRQSHDRPVRGCKIVPGLPSLTIHGMLMERRNDPIPSTRVYNFANEIGLEVFFHKMPTIPIVMLHVCCSTGCSLDMLSVHCGCCDVLVSMVMGRWQPTTNICTTHIYSSPANISTCHRTCSSYVFIISQMLKRSIKDCCTV